MFWVEINFWRKVYREYLYYSLWNPISKYFYPYPENNYVCFPEQSLFRKAVSFQFRKPSKAFLYSNGVEISEWENIFAKFRILLPGQKEEEWSSKKCQMCNLLSVLSRSAPPKSGIFFSYIEKMNYNKIHNLCICSLQMVDCLTSPFFFSFSKEESSKGKWAANKDWTVITEISDLALKFQEMFYRKEGKIKIHVITCRIIKLNTSNALYYTPKFLLFSTGWLLSN